MKGAPLTLQEIDTNFQDLDKRLHRIEKTEFQDFGVVRIETRGDRLLFLGGSDILLGEAVIPTIILKDRGTWKSHTPYAPLDYVIKDNALYICREKHTSEADFISSFWHLSQGDNHE
jgi:hypothetical protein